MVIKSLTKKTKEVKVNLPYIKLLARTSDNSRYTLELSKEAVELFKSSVPEPKLEELMVIEDEGYADNFDIKIGVVVSDEGISINKSNKASNKDFYNILINQLDLNETEDCILLLREVDMSETKEDIHLYHLMPISKTDYLKVIEDFKSTNIPKYLEVHLNLKDRDILYIDDIKGQPVLFDNDGNLKNTEDNFYNTITNKTW